MTFFHIGFPKAASTTLQKQLFDKHSELNFLGVYPTSNIGQDSNEKNKNSLYFKSDTLKQFHNCLTNLEGVEYHFSNVMKYFEDIQPLLSDVKRNIFSNERFTSVLFAHNDRAEKANRIKQLFPDTKIVIVLRNQIDIITSQYRDHPFDPRNLMANKRSVNIDDWITNDFDNPSSISFIKSIEYYKLVKYYSELFGKENISILLFEELVMDLRLFSEQISSFLNIDKNETYFHLNSMHENDGVSKKLNTYRKIKNNFFNHIPQFIKRNDLIKKVDVFLAKKLKSGKKENIKISCQNRKKLYDYYNKGNKQLADEFNLNLDLYGYIHE